MPHLSRRVALIQLSALATLSTATPAKAAKPLRIVSVGGALTEIVFALGAQADLVGVDTTSLFPPSAQKLPSVGYARTLSTEGMLALAPTHVIATEDAGPPAVLRQLSSSGIEVSILRAHHRYEGLVERIQQVGALTGRLAQAEALKQAIHADWTRTRAQISQQRTPPARVLFVLTHAPGQILVAGADTSAQSILEYAGASNAVLGFSGYKPLTPEAVIAAQPDVILLSDQGLQGAGGVAGILQLPGLSQTPAGKKRRVISMEAMLLLGFGPRLPKAISILSTSIGKAMQS